MNIKIENDPKKWAEQMPKSTFDPTNDKSNKDNHEIMGPKIKLPELKQTTNPNHTPAPKLMDDDAKQILWE